MTSATTLLDIKVIDDRIASESYVPIDLSVSNKDLDTVNLDDANNFGDYINNYLSTLNATAAFGGYNEQRNLYRSSAIFGSDSSEERNIHIGLDIWVSEGTPVLAALEGKVHSFANNIGKGNYGPTIILEHQLDQIVFYTLYGHLSLESLLTLNVGDHFAHSQKIGTLGSADVNGGYPPHLHFQVIRDIADKRGDYPGVCSKNELEYYLNNCPDPNLLLKLKTYK
ncbi:MAG TPA: peptidoglycan DD-metalloendopeptidase family protein [Flavobacterium sp.]|jgi:murein DD-endopeptidase MepM/ murein hydrolase activator NlpD